MGKNDTPMVLPHGLSFLITKSWPKPLKNGVTVYGRFIRMYNLSMFVTIVVVVMFDLQSYIIIYY